MNTMESRQASVAFDSRHDFLAIGDPEQAVFARAMLGGRSGLLLAPNVTSVAYTDAGDALWPFDLARVDWPSACVHFVLVDAGLLLSLPHGRVLDLLALALGCARDFVAFRGLTLDGGSSQGWGSLRGFQHLLASLGLSDFELRSDESAQSWTCLVRVRAGVALPQWDTQQATGVTRAAQIDGVVDDDLLGWIDDSERKVGTKYRLLFDDECVATFAADVPRPDVMVAGRFHARGFRVPFPFERLRHEKHVLAIVDERDNELARLAGLLPPDCWGALDSWNGSRLEGWVNAKLVPVPQIDLWLDGVLFQRLSLDPPRDGRARFRCEFPYSPSGAVNMSLDVRLSETDYRLSSSPWRVLFGAPAEPGVDMWDGAPPPLQPLTGVTLPASDRLAVATSTAVIITIFNNADLVRRCIESVLRWTNGPASLILVDDGSSEPEMDLVLRHYAGYERILVVRNPQNVGYTRSIAIGMHYAASADVVLLNSDTEVGPRWLDSLRIAAYSDERIGTVTAVSDNAGAFSVPELEQYCPWPEHWDYPMAARALLQQAGLRYPIMPTGNGFCMFVKRAMLDRVGGPDSNAFPAGYGEENDLCMRGERIGFRHVIAGNVLVRHERSASFGDARRVELGIDGMQVLRARYPEYESAVSAVLHGTERRVLEYRVRRTYADLDKRHGHYPPRQRILFVLATGEGEPAARVTELMSALTARYEPFVLRWDEDALSLYRLDETRLLLEKSQVLERCREFAPSSWHAYERVVRSWLAHYAFELVNIHQLGWHSLSLPALATGLGIPIVYTFHDFHSVCPSVLLRDENKQFCAGRCTAGDGPCKAKYDNENAYPELKHNYVRLWKPQMREILGGCDAFVLADAGLRDVLLDNHPWLAERDLRVVEHHAAPADQEKNQTLPSGSGIGPSIIGLNYSTIYAETLKRRASFADIRKPHTSVVVACLSEELTLCPPLAAALRHASAMGRIEWICAATKEWLDKANMDVASVLVLHALVHSEPPIQALVEQAQRCKRPILWWDDDKSRLLQALAQTEAGRIGLLWSSDQQTIDVDVLICDPAELPVGSAMRMVDFLLPRLGVSFAQ